MIDGRLAESQRMALIDLLDRLLISRADQPEVYRRIFVHEEWLREWLLARPQWRLIGGHGVYRLERLPSLIAPERGLPRLRAPLDYACICWVLWFAERRRADVRDWFVLSELAGEVAAAAAGSFSLGQRQHRESLVRAVMLLEELGVLSHRDGDAERWAAGQETVDGPVEVLYEFTEDAPRLLANFDPASLDRVTGGDRTRRVLRPTGEFAAPKARAWRALLLGPIFWRGDDPEAFAALMDCRDEFVDDLEYYLGWQLELGLDFARIWRQATARGAAGLLIDLVPEAGDGQRAASGGFTAADAGGADEGGAAATGGERHVKYIYHPILLLAGELRRLLAAGRLSADSDGAVAISGGTLRDLILGLQRRYRRNWGAELGQLGAEELVEQVLRQMRLIGYLRGPDELDRCTLLPPALMVTGQYVGGEVACGDFAAAEGADGAVDPAAAGALASQASVSGGRPPQSRSARARRTAPPRAAQPSLFDSDATDQPPTGERSER